MKKACYCTNAQRVYFYHEPWVMTEYKVFCWVANSLISHKLHTWIYHTFHSQIMLHLCSCKYKNSCMQEDLWPKAFIWMELFFLWLKKEASSVWSAMILSHLMRHLTFPIQRHTAYLLIMWILMPARPPSKQKARQYTWNSLTISSGCQVELHFSVNNTIVPLALSMLVIERVQKKTNIYFENLRMCNEAAQKLFRLLSERKNFSEP